MPNEIYQVSYWGYSKENGFGSIYHSYTSEPVETPSEPIELPSEPVPFPTPIPTPTPIEPIEEEPPPKKSK